MSIYLQNEGFFNKPYLLSKKFQKHPRKYLPVFFSSLELMDARKLINELLEAALTTDNGYFNEASERNDAIYFCRQIEELIEAAYLLHFKKTNMKLYKASEGHKLALEHLMSANDTKSAERLQELDKQFFELTEQYQPPRPPEIESTLEGIMAETKKLLGKAMVAGMFGGLLKMP